MQRQTNFETLPLDTIQHLMAEAEHSEEASASPATSCKDCGHPVDDHSIDNDTCWFAIHSDGAVQLCGCRGYRAFE